MTITCFIRYEIDPFQRDGFKKYAENWGRIIPRCGGHLIGYFLPHEGTNNVAWGLIAFDSLASYEAYRARLKSDPEAMENFAMAQTKRLILREERNFVEMVDGTFGLPSTLAGLAWSVRFDEAEFEQETIVAEHTVTVHWQRKNQLFTDNRYSRGHTWAFDGGVEVPASSSPHVLPSPYSDPSAVDPEEAFVASISSCHMLWFLSLAAKRGFCVDSYADDAVGIMEKDQSGRFAMTRVTLRPKAIFSGDRLATQAELQGLHHEAHEQCFIANSVKTEIHCEPVYVG